MSCNVCNLILAIWMIVPLGISRKDDMPYCNKQALHSVGTCVLRLNQYYDEAETQRITRSLNQYVHLGPCTLPFRPQPRVTWVVTYRIDSGALSVNRSWTSRWCHVVLNSVLATFEMFSLWIYDVIAAPKWDRFPVRRRLQWPLYQAGTMRAGAVQEAATAWHRHWYLPPEQDIFSDFSRSKIHTDDVVNPVICQKPGRHRPDTGQEALELVYRKNTCGINSSTQWSMP